MFINFDKVLGVHQKALDLYGQRSKILASNIVNADTPNFKARDIDFRSTLASFTEDLQKGSAGSMKVTLESSETGHINDGANVGFSSEQLVYRVPLQPSLDGNTVDSQTEIAAYTENAIRYQASLRFISGRFKGMISAFRGE